MKRLIKKAEINRDEFNEEQLQILDMAEEERIDLGIFANPKLNAQQLEEIYLGIKNNADIRDYVDENYSAEQMHEIRLAKEENKHNRDFLLFEFIINPDVSIQSMKSFREFLNSFRGSLQSLHQTIDEDQLEELIQQQLESDNPTESLNQWVNQLKELSKSIRYHDINDRDSAIVYLNGKSHETKEHFDAYEKLKKDVDFEKMGFKESLEEDDVMFMANKVEEPSDRDLSGNRKSIYIIDQEYLMKNITIEEAAEEIKRLYPGYKVFVDERITLDLENMKTTYEEL